MKIKIVSALLCGLGFFITSCATTTTTRTSPAKTLPASGVSLSDFKLTGNLGGDVAAFTLTANALVGDAKGGSLELLSGPVALTSLDERQKWNMTVNQNRFTATFDRSGVFPIELHFNASVTQSNDWHAVGFHVAPGVVQPVVLQGLAADTEFQFANAARPERSGTNFVSYLPVDGAVNFAWKTARPEAEGKLFYAAEMVSQISVSPGMMLQAALLNGKIMQGEMTRLVLRLQGAGEVTSVQGQGLLSWTNSGAAGGDREVIVEFNQPQKDSFAVLVQMQTPLGAFPQAMDAVRLAPEGATRFAGTFRIVNNGAVRLEVTQATGLSQISPEQFPEGSLFRATGSQRFAYRFSSADFALRVNADQILPEVGVSEVLAYHLGQNELSVDAQIELDIREAPVRELLVDIPKGYLVAQPVASGLSDSFTDTNTDQLRLVYGQPISGRQIVQIHLERNQSLGETNWTLPRIAVAAAKSTRGFVGVSADNGFRLTPERTQGLTEIATAFFPSQLGGLQSAFRLSDPNWQAAMRVERLPQTVQADAFHLFSIGEGIAYGSSVINYVVSGSPVSAFHVELSDEYANVEFTGQDVRSWEKTTNGYTVQLNTPVSGAYTLLATYERSFKPQGETLAFTGARPLDAQSESGHTIVTSAYQFQVKPQDISPGLLSLEPGEVPAEYRLFFDQPVLAAYSYSARPFNLTLALSPLAQGSSLAQVVDRASLTTHISKEGQALTDARYFVKSRGNPNFGVALPAGSELWSATVNGAAVVPVTDGITNLIPLPQHADPDAVLTLDLKVAATSSVPTRMTLAAPVVAAPVTLAEWRLEPDEGQRLVYHNGTLAPVSGTPDASGFAQISQSAQNNELGSVLVSSVVALLFVVLGILVWRWAAGEVVYKFSLRHLLGAAVGLAAIVFAAVCLVRAASSFENTPPAPANLTFLAPVQQADSGLTVDVGNVAAAEAGPGFIHQAWPALLALAAWVLAWSRVDKFSRAALGLLGWVLAAWAALRWSNGAPAFFAVAGAFLLAHIVIPSAKQLWRVPAKPRTDSLPPPTIVPPAVAALLALGLFGGALNVCAANALPESVTQQIRVENGTATANAKIHWRAASGETLPLLFEPAVLTHVTFPKSLRLETAPAGSRNAQQLVAHASGEFDIEVQYQLQITRRGTDSGFAPPVASGLVNLVTLTLANLDVDVFSPQAVSVQRSASGSNTVAALVLEPVEYRGMNVPEAQPAIWNRAAPHSGAVYHLVCQTGGMALDSGGSTTGTTVTQGIDQAGNVNQEWKLEDAGNGYFNLICQNSGMALDSGSSTADGTKVIQSAANPGNGDQRWKFVSVGGGYYHLISQTSGKTLDNAGSLTVGTGVIQFTDTGSGNANQDWRLELVPSGAWVGWRPRSRDVRNEKRVFLAEFSQLYIPSAGVVEGAHQVTITPAQGEVGELIFDVPPGATITDVSDNPAANFQSATANRQSLVSLWRFDPDTRKLRVTLNSPMSRPFRLFILSQVATGTLPIDQRVGLISVEGAQAQSGSLGVATGNDVQLDDVAVKNCPAMSLEDFPGGVAQIVAAQFPGLTVRRAFRYSDSQATAQLKASAVEPDIRVQTQDTLSLGEDRTLLASTATVAITRAGIFKLSFVLPPGFDVESMSGAALSHWTELKTGADRIITLNLTGKTEGQQQFNITLSGPGVKTASAWAAPQILLREANKQRGTLLVAPEQGMRLQAVTLDGVTQLDPQKAGVRQKGVLAFNILETPWKLALDIERVDAWTQVTSLQQVMINEAQVKVAANLQYQIENAGLKSFRVLVPTNAEGVTFRGDQVGDFVAADGSATNGMQGWDIKLRRRVIGQYLLQLNYQMPLADQSGAAVLRGVQAADVNSQRGFVTVEAGGRLQVHVDNLPASLQPTEWQAIPRALQKDLPGQSASFAYRLVEPDFALPLKLERHEAAKLLPARVNNITLTSVISDAGVMLTRARLEILPGDKRLLHFTLPAGASFWFAFVNQNGVWPWREGGEILIPLEQQSRGDQPEPVEIYFSSDAGKPGGSTLDLDLLAPKFDLPLENLTWRVFLNDKWQVKKWSGALQLQQQEIVAGNERDLQSYLQTEAVLQQQKTKQAEQMLTLGNSALLNGDPQQARSAFAQAYNLSHNDAAFNEDARVQLNNLKLQQALVGLNVLNSWQGGAQSPNAAPIANTLSNVRNNGAANYTQQDAKQIIDNNSADANAAFMKLADRLIKQQEAAVANPAVIRANIPEQGRLLTFKRAVVVDTWADLNIAVKARAAAVTTWGLRLLVLAATALVFAGLGLLARSVAKTRQD